MDSHGRTGATAEASVVASGSDALDDVNEAFHAAYDDVRAHAEHVAPVLVVLADVLILHARGRRTELAITPPMFHVVKSVAHAPVALHALLLRAREGPGLDDATLGALRGLRGRLERAARDVRADASSVAGGDEPRSVGRMAEDMHHVLRATSAFADEAMERRAVSGRDLAAFARELGPALLRLTEDATRIQLEALHARVEEAVAALDDAERGALEVVVTGAHQARARSFAMQYFQSRLGEREGFEERVAYGEGVETEADALALIGTRRLDRAIARAFFGDPHRLQRDVLGDAAAHVLRGMRLSRL